MIGFQWSCLNSNACLHLAFYMRSYIGLYMRHSVKVIKQRVVGSQVLAPQADELAIEDPLELVIRYRAHDRFVED